MTGVFNVKDKDFLKTKNAQFQRLQLPKVALEKKRWLATACNDELIKGQSTFSEIWETPFISDIKKIFLSSFTLEIETFMNVWTEPTINIILSTENIDNERTDIQNLKSTN